MTVAEPEDPICRSCKEQREQQKLPPQEKLFLPIKTEKHNFDVLVCPDCDHGVEILKHKF